MPSQEENQIPVFKASDTMYSIPAGLDEASRITTIAAGVSAASEHCLLTETSKAERLALSRKDSTNDKNDRNDSVHGNAVIVMVSKMWKTIIQIFVEIIDNFDAVLGALSYVTASLSVVYYKSGRLIEGAIFFAITGVLVVAKHRPGAGWLISLLKAPIAELRERITKKYADIQKTLK